MIKILQNLNLVDENNDYAGNITQKREKSHILNLLLQWTFLTMLLLSVTG